MSHLILPNRQIIRSENEVEFLRRTVKKLKLKLIEQDNTHQARLLSINQDVQKLDKILTDSFDRIDAYEKKLKDLKINPEDLWKK